MLRVAGIESFREAMAGHKKRAALEETLRFLRRVYQ